MDAGRRRPARCSCCVASSDGRRPIRSFVRRAGRMTASQQRALAELWPDFGIEYSSQRLDFAQLFGRHAATVLEIGFGNGDSLVQLAAEHPELNFLGIEVHDPGIGHCMLAAKGAAVANLKLIAHDAIEVLESSIDVASLARINLYFPDPWPKKRHHKRRIVQPAFVELCASRLASRGCVAYRDRLGELCRTHRCGSCSITAVRLRRAARARRRRAARSTGDQV